MKPEDILMFDRRMNDLDVEHARARSPAQRKRVERKMRQLREDLVKLKVAEATVDLAYRRWLVDIEKRFAAILGPSEQKPS